MRRIFLLVLTLAFLLLACQAVTFPSVRISKGTPTVATQAPPTATLPPTRTLRPKTGLPSSLQAPYTVRYHPDGGLYVGDQVSFEIIAPQGADVAGRSAWVDVAGEPAEFERYGIAGRNQATLTWAWDTAGLEPGSYELTFSIQPDGQQWTETVVLLPESELPPEQAGARWARAESDCCLLYYITHTEAERDIEALAEMADAQAEYVEARYQAELPKPVNLVILSRVLGHGGFTNDQAISVSYLDRRYSGGEAAIILRHEMVHYLDHALGGELRPTMLVEGVAVYLSGGHFKDEPLLPRAAALLELGWYKPLASLADDFYPSQHETGYLEAGALVAYMVERWGWEAFDQFYRDIRPGPPGTSQLEAMDEALRGHFGIRFEELEAGFLERLRSQAYTQANLDDVRLSVLFYDTVRRYQQALDPSAYYLTAWLPDGEQMRQRGIVADTLRHPSATANVLVESLLVAADERLRAGDYVAAKRLLETANGVLDGL